MALQPNWLDLPRDLTIDILKRLGLRYIFVVAQHVCVTWYRICKDPSMWLSITMVNLFIKSSRMRYHHQLHYLRQMCRRAIDRSRGQLMKISLGDYATEDLLKYVANRAPQLKYLQLVYSYDLSTEGLVEIAKKLPNLEDLYVVIARPPDEVLKIFGHHCPKLKSLTYDNMFFTSADGDGVALSIAETMHGLRHLALYGNEVTNYGLQEILNHCPHLESLELRYCPKVKLEGTLESTCAQRIKNLKYLKGAKKGKEKVGNIRF